MFSFLACQENSNEPKPEPVKSYIPTIEKYKPKEDDKNTQTTSRVISQCENLH